MVVPTLGPLAWHLPDARDIFHGFDERNIKLGLGASIDLDRSVGQLTARRDADVL